MRTDLDNIVNQLRMSMNSDAPKLGYAVIGTGMMGREHIRAVHQLNQARIVGVFDTNTQMDSIIQYLNRIVLYCLA